MLKVNIYKKIDAFTMVNNEQTCSEVYFSEVDQQRYLHQDHTGKTSNSSVDNAR